MKNKIRAIAALAVITLPLILAYTQNAADAAEPGSEQDPLVSKSYVDARIAEALAQIPAQTQPAPQVISPVMGGGASFIPVNLLPGQIAIGEEGTEMILRSGSGVAYHMGEDGLVNVTEGSELTNGDAVLRNNLIIVPRADGRGIMVHESSWLIIKGGYYVTN